MRDGESGVEASRFPTASANESQSPREQALDALEFAVGAIWDAIGAEDGLDGGVGEKVLALMYAALRVNGRQVCIPSEDEAYDRLAALREPLWSAAPDLLSALKGLLAQSSDPSATTGEFDTAAGQAFRAIAKAEGR